MGFRGGVASIVADALAARPGFGAGPGGRR